MSPSRNASREARFDGTFEGFRDEARALLTKGIPPESVVWVPEDDPQDTIPGLLAPVSHPPPPPAARPARRTSRARSWPSPSAPPATATPAASPCSTA